MTVSSFVLMIFLKIFYLQRKFSHWSTVRQGSLKSTARCFDLQGGPRHAGHTMQEQEHVNVTKSSTLEQITLHVL